MKNILIVLLILPFIANAQELTKKEKRAIAASGAAKHYNIPVNERTQKISYNGEVKLAGSKEKLYKRALQFIAFQNWDKVVNIKCKNAMPVSMRIIEKAITYEDDEDGVVIGNGYTLYPLERASHFVLTFKYKISTKEGMYKYEFTDFEVLEFVSGERAKRKSSAVAYGGFATGGGQTRFYGIDVRPYPMEEFVDFIGYYEQFNPEMHYRFKEIAAGLKKDLNSVMQGEF